MLIRMNKPLFLIFLALLPLAACNSEQKKVEERALELCSYIPGHGLSDNADKYLTDSYLRAYQEAMDIPEWVEYAGEIGEKEFIFYDESGNGSGEPEFRLQEVRMIDKEHAEADVTIVRKWEDGTVDEESAGKGTMKLLLVGDEWRLDDFDGTKEKCRSFVKKIRAGLDSGAALDSLKASGWVEEDYLDRFIDDVDQFYKTYGK